MPTVPAQHLDAEQKAQQAAAVWLPLLDSGKYAESWDQAAGVFHKLISKDGWVTLLKSGMPVFGTPVSRKLKTATYTRILPGAPDGDYVVIAYQTEFSVMKEAVETVTTVRDADGIWRVAGYHIK
jgi:hypothetical protein